MSSRNYQYDALNGTDEKKLIWDDGFTDDGPHLDSEKASEALIPRQGLPSSSNKTKRLVALLALFSLLGLTAFWFPSSHVSWTDISSTFEAASSSLRGQLASSSLSNESNSPDPLVLDIDQEEAIEDTEPFPAVSAATSDDSDNIDDTDDDSQTDDLGALNSADEEETEVVGDVDETPVESATTDHIEESEAQDPSGDELQELDVDPESTEWEAIEEEFEEQEEALEEQESAVQNEADVDQINDQPGIVSGLKEAMTANGDILSSSRPICKKTFLYEVAGETGFCSEMNALVRFGLWARLHGYAFIVNTTDEWIYGSYTDYFELPKIDCELTDDMRNRESSIYRRISSKWTNRPHLYAHHWDREFVDHWLMEEMLDMPSLLNEPAIDTSRALPLDLQIPDGGKDAFEMVSKLTEELWKPLPDIASAEQQVIAELGLQDTNRGHVIGLHWRGGDKIAHECPHGNCGNVSLYLQEAINLLDSLPQAQCADCQPTLVVMTIEPGILELLAADPLSARFHLRDLPPPAKGRQTFNKGNFFKMSMQDRIEQTSAMIRDLTALSRMADGFVVTGSSNVGRMAFLLGGPQAHIASVDLPLHLTIRPLDYYLEPKPRTKQQHSRRSNGFWDFTE